MRAVSLSRSRLAVAAAFLIQGFVFISLTTRLPDFSDLWSLSEVELSLLLLGLVLLAGVGTLLAERLAPQVGSAALLRASLVAMAAVVPIAVLAPSVAVFYAAVAAYGVVLGIVDAVVNMQAVALEHRYDRPILPSFHGSWTLGGLVASALTLATAHVALDWVALLAVVPLAAVAAPYLAHERSGAPEVDSAVPWRPILLVGAALVLFYMVDTAAFTWGPTYLDRAVDAPSDLVALATFPYLLASGLVRLAGDGLVRRHGPVLVLRVGALVACLGLAVVVFAPSWPVAVLGFLVMGAGVAVVAPLSFSAAARIAGGELDPAQRRARVDAVIARFNQFNYVGALLGAVMTGLVGAGSLRVGFAVPMVLVLGLLPLAKAFRP
ncbi:MFS transporter [Nocardioides agariphilus]|jgi:MFS family permease|uniref:MFS transporter n=1 Tax=Nocardioides agariphilus TaxID=433664 RepID=A0A930VGW6_9ACTN|nr:MFS transporter [Nocardioides agariphilus]MBF4766382.1 MFS transporter [Nocardioides agariphilus]